MPSLGRTIVAAWVISALTWVLNLGYHQNPSPLLGWLLVATAVTLALVTVVLVVWIIGYARGR